MKHLSDWCKKVTNQSLEKLNTFCETSGLSNLVKGHACHSKTHKLSIDLISINKNSSFQLTNATEQKRVQKMCIF